MNNEKDELNKVKEVYGTRETKNDRSFINQEEKEKEGKQAEMKYSDEELRRLFPPVPKGIKLDFEEMLQEHEDKIDREIEEIRKKQDGKRQNENQNQENDKKDNDKDNDNEKDNSKEQEDKKENNKEEKNEAQALYETEIQRLSFIRNIIVNQEELKPKNKDAEEKDNKNQENQEEKEIDD